jgi:heterodisulfide reductase subunit A2
MKVGVYFCRCGGIVADKVDGEEIRRRLAGIREVAYFRSVELACGDEGKAEMVADLKEKQPDRVVVIACSPREHEETFRSVLASAGLNPFLLQMVNVREHVAWVTEDPRVATDKAFHQVRAAVARVCLHEPLEKREIDVNTGILIIGAGPAGLKAALTLAEAGRKVVLVEKGPILGGMPVRYEEVFPRMECGPCVLEPFMAEAMQGPHAQNIEILLTTEVVEVAGSFGTFSVKLRKTPRYVDLDTCVGCAACIEPCPVSHPNPVNCNLSTRKAMDFVFFGGLPNAPYLDPEVCLRMNGKDPSCEACRTACPVEGAVHLDAEVQIVERQVGAILLAVGGALYDCQKLPQFGYGKLTGVVNSLEFERMAAGSGPTSGEIRLPDGRALHRVAIVHCVGSLDPHHNTYCSAVCCMNAFKFNKLLAHKLPKTHVSHYFKTLVMPGKDDADLYQQVAERAETTLIPYSHIDELTVEKGSDGRISIRQNDKTDDYDMVVLMPALILAEGTKNLAKLLDVGLDRHGFCEELHGSVDATKSKARGIYLAGTCQAPMDLGRAMTQGSSAAGVIMAALVPGRKLQIEAVHAEVDADRCSGCRSCLAVCPYRALSFDDKREIAEVNPIRCVGCGTCVAACPSGVIKGKHFSNDQIFAEIEGILA